MSPPQPSHHMCRPRGTTGNAPDINMRCVKHEPDIFPRLVCFRTSARAPVRGDGLTLEILKNYGPSEKEPFMNEPKREYFRAKLLDWKDEILKEVKQTLQTLQEENVNHPDLADRASSETNRAIELRARDRQRKLISKIDAALQRIEDNTYGARKLASRSR
jgi:RNA polymerase-binding protein DksA